MLRGAFLAVATAPLIGTPGSALAAAGALASSEGKRDEVTQLLVINQSEAHR